jgi:predicted nucleic acid-binding protein
VSKLLLDTNVLIYSIDEGSKYFGQVQKLFSEPFELCTTSKNLSEFLAVITRIPKHPLPINDALLIVEDFINVLTIYYPTQESFLTFQNLIHKYKPIGLQIHDFEIVSIGLTNKITTIVTFNEKDFKK